ncbi:MAG: acyltransferase [Proteobacteria bacterium]|nr:acyltransferase [Pseudomonadota bacterium]
MSQAQPAAAPRADRYLTLEVSRFLAALFVAVGHLAPLSASMGCAAIPFNFDLPAKLPVLLFFVLSGFVIQSAHGDDAGKPRRLRRYAWRRCCRIYPVYWVCILIPLYYFVPVSSTANLAGNLTLFPFVGQNFREMNAPAWSLRFELSYYLMFGLLLIRPIRRPVFCLWVGAILAHWLLQLTGFKPHLPYGAWLAGPIFRFFGIHSFLFLSGMGAAALHARHRLSLPALWRLLGVCAVLLAISLPYQHWGFDYPPVILEPLIGLLIAGGFLALAGLERGGALRPPGWFVWLGAVSYPLYLIHPCLRFLLAYHVQFLHMPCPRPLVTFFGTLGCSLVLALIIAAMDRPFQRFARRLI